MAGPVPGDQPVSLELYVGGKSAEVTYRGRSGCCAGIDQIVFKVPQGVEGCYVNVALSVNNVVSNVGTMSIAASGKVCAEATRLSASDLSRLPKTGSVTVGDISVVRMNVTAGSVQGTFDTGSASFRRYTNYQEVMAAAPQSIVGLKGTPTPGSCTVIPYAFGPGSSPWKAIFPSIQDPPGAQVDAGANLRLVNAQGTQTIARQSVNGGVDGYYLPDNTALGGGLPAAGIPLKPEFLEPGRLTIDNGAGGAIGSFDASITIPSTQATWANQSALSVAFRSQAFDVRWTGGAANELVIIVGSSADPAVNAGSAFVCVERASVGSFTVPAYVMSAMPASGNSNGMPVGWLSFSTTLATPTRFSTTNLDAGFLNYWNARIQNVTFR
jgi:hypothetical protein